MIKINYKEPTESETLDDIAVSNIKMCDKYKKADYLEVCCISWLKIDTKRNYQDLEQLFRNLNLDTWVIAQTINTIPTGLRIGKPNESKLEENIEDTKLEYIAKINCMGKDESMKELLKYHSNWEENYECLKKTGCLISVKQETSKEEEEYISQAKGVEEIKKLLDCKLKLELEYYSVQESIDFITNDIKVKYGKIPEKIICGEMETNKVWALVIDGQIVSPIGWVEKIINQKDNTIYQETINTEGETNTSNTSNTSNTPNITKYELIDFRKIKKE